MHHTHVTVYYTIYIRLRSPNLSLYPGLELVYIV